MIFLCSASVVQISRFTSGSSLWHHLFVISVHHSRIAIRDDLVGLCDQILVHVPLFLEFTIAELQSEMTLLACVIKFWFMSLSSLSSPSKTLNCSIMTSVMFGSHGEPVFNGSSWTAFSRMALYSDSIFFAVPCIWAIFCALSRDESDIFLNSRCKFANSVPPWFCINAPVSPSAAATAWPTKRAVMGRYMVASRYRTK